MNWELSENTERNSEKRNINRKAVLDMDKNYITDEQVVKRANIAVKLEIEKKKAMDIPIALYDSETQSIYQENSDGTREVVAKRLREGRYSERISKKA